MKLSLTILCFISCLCYGQDEPKRNEIDLRMEETTWRNSSRYKDLSWITEDIRPVVIEKLLSGLRPRDAANGDGYSRHNIEVALVAIGHIETIQKLVERMRVNDDGQSALMEGSTEVTIPFVMDLVYHGSTEQPKMVDDIAIYPMRTAAFRIVLRAIYTSKVFPEETRAWGRKMEETAYLHYEPTFDLLKEWWEHNQQAMQEKRYSDVTWLPTHKGKIFYGSIEEHQQRNQDNKPKRLPLQAKPDSEGDATPLPAVKRWWSVWSVGAVAMVLLPALYWWKLAFKAK